MSDVAVHVNADPITVVVATPTLQVVEETEQDVVIEVADDHFVTGVQNEGAVEVITVAVPGPAGPRGAPGPQGEPGLSGGSFEQVFAQASDTWLILHNLGYTPNVSLYDTTGRQIRGSIVENTPTHTRVTYYFPVAGRATAT